jgi:hypothetical protein
LALLAGAVAWIAAAAVGLNWLDRGSARPGTPAEPPAVWPTDCLLPRATDRPTLVMFVHPRCPCSRASLAELAGIMAGREDVARAVVVVYSPAGAPGEWAQSDRWRQAAAIRGAEVVADAAESERRRFAVFTSGQVLVYDTKGQRMYAGGTTGGRGHGGPNPGRSAIEALLDGRPAPRPDAPVFGCPLTCDPGAPSGDQ